MKYSITYENFGAKKHLSDQTVKEVFQFLLLLFLDYIVNISKDTKIPFKSFYKASVNLDVEHH